MMMALAAVAVVALAAWVVFHYFASTPLPAQLIAKPGDGQVNLQWTNGTADCDEYDAYQWEYQQYQLKRDGDIGQGWKSIPEVDAAKRRYHIDNLTNGWTYVFRVRATNKEGHGTPSNEAIAVPEAAPEVVVSVPGNERIEEQLGRLKEHLVGNELDLSAVETALARIEGLLRKTPPPATLLPVHLLVHFRNAQLSDVNGTLDDRGVALEPVHRTMLKRTVDTLAGCAGPGSPVRIRPYGFASSAPFAGRDDTDVLNVKVANRRAREVYRTLVRLSADEPNVNIEDAPVWGTFEEMVARRNACIESPSGERVRDSFLDRVVVLELQTMGSCAMAGWTAGLIRCSNVDR